MNEIEQRQFFFYGNKMIRKLWNLGWTTGLSKDPCVLHNPGFQTLRWWFREDFSWFFPCFPNIFQYFSGGFFMIFHIFPMFFPIFFHGLVGLGISGGLFHTFSQIFFQFSVAHRQRPAPWWFRRHGDSLAAELERFRERSQIWACVSAAEEYDLQTFNRWISHIYVKW